MLKLILLFMCIAAVFAHHEHGHRWRPGSGGGGIRPGFFRPGGFRPRPPFVNLEQITELLKQIINLMRNPGGNSGTTVAPSGNPTLDQILASLLQIINMLNNGGASTTPGTQFTSTPIFQSTTPAQGTSPQSTAPDSQSTTPVSQSTTPVSQSTV